MSSDLLRSETQKFDVPEQEKRKNAFISLYYFVVLVLIGLPMWYFTTLTYRSSLPISDIADLTKSKIIVAIKVNLIGFDNNLEMDQLFALQDNLLQKFDNASSSNDETFVQLKFTGHVRKAVRDEARILQHSKAVSELDGICSNLDNDAINVLIVPSDCQLFQTNKHGLLRARGDRSIVLVRVEALERMVSVIADLVMNVLARSDDLNIVYQAAIDVPAKENLDNIPTRLRPLLTRARTAPKYDWTFSLIVSEPSGHSSGPEWDFPHIEHHFLEPLVRKLSPFVSVAVSSQLVYQVRLQRIWPSQRRGNERLYSRADLTHVVNGIEAYISGPGGGSQLHFVAVMDSTDSVRFEGANGIPVDAFSVPRWGAVALLQKRADNSTSIDGAGLMGVFLPQIISLMGLAHPSVDSGLAKWNVESPDASLVSPWQLHRWMRERTVENIAITRRTLQSVVVLLDRVANMVIRDDVAANIRTATWRAQTALQALRSSKTNGGSGDNELQIAFLSSKQALEAAEMAFFHPSLLELLYFQDDQKIGIYIPLFVPLILPVLLATLKARPYLASVFKRKSD